MMRPANAGFVPIAAGSPSNDSDSSCLEDPCNVVWLLVGCGAVAAVGAFAFMYGYNLVQTIASYGLLIGLIVIKIALRWVRGEARDSVNLPVTATPALELQQEFEAVPVRE